MNVTILILLEIILQQGNYRLGPDGIDVTILILLEIILQQVIYAYENSFFKKLQSLFYWKSFCNFS